MFNLVVDGLTPDGGPGYLQDLGYAIAIRPVDLFGAAAHAMIAALAKLGGTMATEPGRSPQALFKLVGLDEWQALRRRLPALTRLCPGATTPHASQTPRKVCKTCRDSDRFCTQTRAESLHPPRPAPPPQ